MEEEIKQISQKAREELLEQIFKLTGDTLSVDTPQQHREVSEFHIALRKLLRN